MRLAVVASITMVAAIGPVWSVGTDARAPAEIETKIGTFEDDEFLTPTADLLSVRLAHGIDLGPHGPAVTVPSHPFLEVPENPPERG